MKLQRLWLRIQSTSLHTHLCSLKRTTLTPSLTPYKLQYSHLVLLVPSFAHIHIASTASLLIVVVIVVFKPVLWHQQSGVSTSEVREQRVDIEPTNRICSEQTSCIIA